ncbi:hypothetical protein HNQ08_002757 [Deinococcus humi]|uniref:Uncharacterized protein n=1 Tax=Deinococcus humi TaxID=662880 RepID=A0A7W8JUY5_9DEIO|nr:hypothetical protein [Deinococcus humi]
MPVVIHTALEFRCRPSRTSRASTPWSTFRWCRPLPTTPSLSTPTVPPGGRHVSSEASGHENAHRASWRCTPASRICITLPVPPFPLYGVGTINELPSRPGKRLCGRRPEVQAACLRIPLCFVRANNLPQLFKWKFSMSGTQVDAVFAVPYATYRSTTRSKASSHSLA